MCCHKGSLTGVSSTCHVAFTRTVGVGSIHEVFKLAGFMCIVGKPINVKICCMREAGMNFKCGVESTSGFRKPTCPLTQLQTVKPLTSNSVVMTSSDSKPVSHLNYASFAICCTCTTKTLSLSDCFLYNKNKYFP